MVATLVRLRWRLTLNALRSSIWAVLGLLMGGVYALGAAAVLTSMAVLLGAAGDVDGALTVLGAVGAALTLGWVLVPLLLTGQDGTLDPRSLASWVAPSRSLSRGLAVAAACGLPGLVTALVCLLPTLVWALTGQWAAVGTALLMAPVALATCVLLSRVVVTSAGLSSTRRGRDVLAVVAVTAVLLGSLAPSLLMGRLSTGGGLEALRGAARAAGLSPLGWAFTAPGLVATGRWGPALACGLGALAVPVLLTPLWDRVVRRVMVTPTGGGGAVRAYTTAAREDAPGRSAQDAVAPEGTALVDVLPWQRRLARLLPSSAAAVAARCLRYWRTDPRYLAQLIAMVVLPLVLVVVVVVGATSARDGVVSVTVAVDVAWGSAPPALLALPVVLGLLTGWGLHNDLAYDSTARWTHLGAGLRGQDDLLGRTVAASVWQVPLVVVSTLLVAGWTGRWEWVPLVLGTALALLGCAYGWSAVMSVLLPYETNAPGDSPMRSRTSGTALVASLIQMTGWLVLPLVTAPVTGVAAVVAATGAWAWGAAVAVLGLVWGLLGALMGVRRGGALLDRRGARVLATVRSWPRHDQPT